MTATSTPARRTLRYANLDEILADAEQLSKQKLRTIGRWTYPQILEHLAKSVTASIDGYGFQAPWFARVLIAPLVKNSILSKGMRPGFTLPKTAAPIIPGGELSIPAALDNLRKALARFQTESQRSPHPFLGKLASQEYTALHLRHAELHMSFVVPEGAAGAGA